MSSKYNEVVQSDELIKVGVAVGVWSLINCRRYVGAVKHSCSVMFCTNIAQCLIQIHYNVTTNVDAHTL